MRLARATAVVEAEERFAGVTLEEVVSSHVSSAVEIAERAASFGSDLACRRPLLTSSDCSARSAT